MDAAPTTVPFGLAIPAIWAARVLAAAFLGVLFTQSGLDKVTDWRGNVEYFTSHFAKSPLARTVRPMLAVITLIEVTAGILSAIGAITLLLGHGPALAYAGALVAGIGLTALFFGQRVAKDYVGAAVLVPYFLLALASILLQGWNA